MNGVPRQSGFSLIELLVAATLFTFVMMGVSQLFIQAIDLQRRATGYQKIQENALFVLESIAREVRVSAVTTGNTDCTAGGIAGADELVIEHPDSGTVTYRYDRSSGRGFITREASGETGGAQAISSEDIDVTRFAFCVSGKGAGDNLQARITVPATIEAISGRASGRVRVSLQTTMTSRDFIEELTN